MLFTIKDDINICSNLNLTPTQLMFIKMLIPDIAYDEDKRRKESYSLSLKYQSELGGLSAVELSDLVSRDIIINHNDFGKFFLEYFEINPKFLNLFTLQVYPMPAELHDKYPNFFNVGGKNYVAKSVSPGEIAEDYLKAINNDPEEHKRVLEDVEWAKVNNGIVLGIKKFVVAKFWLAIREQRRKGGTVRDVKIV